MVDIEPSVFGQPLTTLEQCHHVFRRWLGDEYDLDVLDAVLCALAVERLDGDPLWLLVISGPGAAKTETVQACVGAGAFVTSTISSDAALLSGSPKRDKASDATGGLLRRIGNHGALVIKDFTSILSANRDLRATVFAAMREVYDGYWERNLGVDGGRSLSWSGRITVIGAVTTAWDTAHAAIATMGDRFVSCRLDSTAGRHAAGLRTAANTGDETAMRAELAAAVGGVLAGLDASRDLTLADDEIARLLAAADLVTLARTGVEYDYKGDVIDAHAPEMPTRYLRQLQQIVRGGLALGMDRAMALRLAVRCARDSVPPIRLAIVDDLAEHPHSPPPEIRRRVDMPWRTVDRQCQALHMLGVVDVDEVEYGEHGRSRWYYTLADGIDPAALQSAPVLSVPTLSPSVKDHEDHAPPGGGPDISGAVQPHVNGATCQRCGGLNPSHPRLCDVCLADLHHIAPSTTTGHVNEGPVVTRAAESESGRQAYERAVVGLLGSGRTPTIAAEEILRLATDLLRPSAYRRARVPVPSEDERHAIAAQFIHRAQATLRRHERQDQT